ncbi:9280_t:CDS:1 [Ambispora gerdemannii]|uniref:9280_t:CDS:1 n=1 Tax=Ambispora gerdemannii TaxID=144530 RepID=A0A9N9BIY5_9GLOM|nr:9280_t:CDS:1 [Ambispora gerdemannii]
MSPSIPLFRGFQREHLPGFFERLERSFIIDVKSTSTITTSEEKLKILEHQIASEAKRWYTKVDWNQWHNDNTIATYEDRKNWMLENFPFHSTKDQCGYKKFLKQGPLESPKNFLSRIKKFVIKEQEASHKGIDTKDSITEEDIEEMFIDGLLPPLQIYISQLTTATLTFGEHVNRVARRFSKGFDNVHNYNQSKPTTHRRIINWKGIEESQHGDNDHEEYKNLSKFPALGAVHCIKQGTDESPWDYYIRLGDACEHDGLDVDQYRVLLYFRGLQQKIQDHPKVWNAKNIEEQIYATQIYWTSEYWDNRHYEAHLEFTENGNEYRQVDDNKYDFSKERISILPVSFGEVDPFYFDFMQPSIDVDSCVFAFGGSSGRLF